MLLHIKQERLRAHGQRYNIRAYEHFCTLALHQLAQLQQSVV